MLIEHLGGFHHGLLLSRDDPVPPLLEYYIGLHWVDEGRAFVERLAVYAVWEDLALYRGEVEGDFVTLPWRSTEGWGA